MKRLRVLLVSTSYPLQESDWRGRFIYDLASSLGERDDVDLRLWAPPGPIPKRVTSVATPAESEWLHKLLVSGGIAHALRVPGIRRYATAARLLMYLRSVYRRQRDVDVVHVNWLQNALPLFWLPHPALVNVLGADFALLRYRAVTAVLKRVLAQRRCVVAPNAGWMRPRLESVFGATVDVQPVSFGVDARWFQIQRAAVDGAKRKWLVVARVTRDKLGPLFEWGDGVFDGSNELHVFGPMQEQVPMPSWVQYHGPVDPRELARQWYPQAAGLISVSVHSEGRPQVLLEAMAAGLPVIVSPLPAHRDVVIPGETGFVVDSAAGLRSSLATLSDTTINAEIGNRARKWVREHVGTWADCSARYATLYHQLADAV